MNGWMNEEWMNEWIVEQMCGWGQWWFIINYFFSIGSQFWISHQNQLISSLCFLIEKEAKWLSFPSNQMYWQGLEDRRSLNSNTIGVNSWTWMI